MGIETNERCYNPSYFLFPGVLQWQDLLYNGEPRYLKGKAKQHIVIEVYESQKIILELTCQHNFSRYEDKQHNSWFYHSVDKARKQFWFITVQI